MTDLKEFERSSKGSSSDKETYSDVSDVSFSDEGPSLDTFDFFEISHISYQHLNFLLIYSGLCHSI